MSEQKPSEQEYETLIRLAALAAGHEVKWAPEWMDGAGCWMRRVVPEPPFPCSEWVPWNPQEDDGDALRLAVKLGLLIDNPGDDQSSKHVVIYGSPAFIRESVGDDPVSATRRAIFRAAVETGRAIEKKGVAS